jgi:hypothetical protein
VIIIRKSQKLVVQVIDVLPDAYGGGGTEVGFRDITDIRIRRDSMSGFGSS